MSEKMVCMLEEILVEIDSLILLVKTYDHKGHMLEFISQWATNGSLLDGGRSIRIGAEGRELQLPEGEHNVYDVLGTMYTVFHTGS
jgi:hypothetical protein